MTSVGWALIVVATWLIFAGYNGINPLTTISDIIRNPAQAQEIIRGSKKPLGGLGISGGGTNGDAVVAFARAQLGKPYVYAGSGPNSYDCSGLTKAAYASVGINLPHSAGMQMAIGQKIGLKKDLLPGDLLFPSVVGTVAGGHVQIYSGNGNIIEAAKPGTNVRERSMWGFPGDNVRATRPIK